MGSHNEKRMLGSWNKALVVRMSVSLSFLLVATETVWGSINIPLTVQESLPAGVSGKTRADEPVTVGIPLPEQSGVTNINRLGLSGVNKGQFRALAYWPNGNIKWVLADFQASVQANSTNVSVALVSGTGNFGGINLAVDDGASIGVNTGAAQFVIKKANFNFFEQVAVNGVTLVDSPETGGVLMRDLSNTVFASYNDTTSTAVIEENGPVRAVVRADGSLKNNSGNRLMDYTVRFHFFAGKSYVRMLVTYRNASFVNTDKATFNSAEVTVPLALPGALSFDLARKTGTVSGSLTGAQTAYLYQAFSRDRLDTENNSWNCGTWGSTSPPIPRACPGSENFAETGLLINHDGTTLNALGNPDDWTQGYAELRDSNGHGVTVVQKWMSALWPAGFEFDGGGRVSVELFSKRNARTDGIRFAWGAHEIREIVFDFHASLVNNQSVLYLTEYPLVARAPFSHYRDLGVFFGETKLPTAQEQTAWLQTNWDIPQSAPSLENPPAMVVRFWNYGDGGGLNQIDLALGEIYNFLRTGHGGWYLNGERRNLFNIGAAVRRSDGFDFNTNRVDPSNGGSFNNAVYDFEHPHWTAMPLFYYLTGNEAIPEAIKDFGEWSDGETRTGEVAQFVIDENPHIRVWSRHLRNFALLYEFTENTRYHDFTVQMLNDLLDSRDTPPNYDPKGRNLDRGYIHMRQGGSDNGQRHSKHFMFTQIHPEQVWKAVRVLQHVSAPFPRREEVEGYLLGLADYIYNEMYFEHDFDGDGIIEGFGFNPEIGYNLTPGYNLDTVNTATSTSTKRLNCANSSLPMRWAYEQKGDLKYLSRGVSQLICATSFASSRSIDEIQSQVLMWHDINRNTTGWRDVTNVTAQNNGGGSYTLRWTVPPGTSQYQIKYAEKPIVDWLGFNQATRTYQFDPANYRAFFAAIPVSDEPTPESEGTEQTYTISGLDLSKTWHFAVKYAGETVPSSVLPPASPTNLQVIP